MASPRKCSLLTIPREIRNLIYENLTLDCTINPRREHARIGYSPANTQVSLRGAIDPSLLLLNHQLHDEYEEHTLPRSELVLNYREGWCNLDTGWEFKPSFRIELLRDVRSCTLQIPWSEIVFGWNGSLIYGWFESHSVEELRQQEDMDWTPSQGFCSRVKQTLEYLGTLLHEQCKVKVEISLNGLWDPDDLLQVGLPHSAPVDRPVLVERIPFAIDLKTIAALETDARYPWPKAGNLGVVYSMFVPLYCTPEDLKKTKARPSRYGVFGDGKMMLWELHPTDDGDENNFRGFFPRMKGFAYNEPE